MPTANNDRPPLPPNQRNTIAPSAKHQLGFGQAIAPHPPAPASTRQHPSSHSPAIAQAPNHSKAPANFCQHEQGDRQVPQAFVQLGLSDGECDRAWVRRRGNDRSYRHEGTHLGDRESKALVLAIAPLQQNYRHCVSHYPPQPMQICVIAASGCRFPSVGTVAGSWDFAYILQNV